MNLPYTTEEGRVNVVASRSHMFLEAAQFVRKVKADCGDIEIKIAGSSLKLCLVAEEQVEVYPRFAPTITEWDACARTGWWNASQTAWDETLTYNKEVLLNPWFVAIRAGYGMPT